MKVNNYKILVIGDSCEDKFVYGDCSRLCPEAPVPVFNPIKETTNPGMAGNVAKNIEALGFTVDLVTNSNKITKTRIVDSSSNQMLVRIDENDYCDRIGPNVLSNIPFSQYKAVVISDYNKGFLTNVDIREISRCHHTVFMDTKKLLGPYCRDIDYIKINDVEYNRTLETIQSVSYDVNEKLIVTKGKNGATYKGVNYPTTPSSVQVDRDWETD